MAWQSWGPRSTRTQLLNQCQPRDGGTLVELPGYGFAKAPKKVREAWRRRMMDVAWACVVDRTGLLWISATKGDGTDALRGRTRARID